MRYLRWGAHGKVRQLDETYPHLRDEVTAPHAPTAIAETVEHLDLGNRGQGVGSGIG